MPSATRVVVLVGVALVVMVVNVALSFGYVALYSYLINPGHPAQFYRDYAVVAAPFCSIVAGIPLFFLAGRWAGRTAPAGSDPVRNALVIWTAYLVIDVVALLGSGITLRLGLFLGVSIATKLAAGVFGALRPGVPRAQVPG